MAVNWITPMLTKDMMAQTTISLGVMSLMQHMRPDPSPAMAAPRRALMKRLEEVATKDWLEVLRTSEKQ